MDKLIKAINEIQQGYKEKERQDGSKYYVYEGKYEDVEREARFQTDKDINDINLVAEIASDGVDFLAENLSNYEDIDAFNDSLSDDLYPFIDNLCIYTADNDKLLSQYGYDNAIDLYVDNFGTADGIKSATLAFCVRESIMTEYISNLSKLLLAE
jgi:hypothetical protein